MSDDPGTDRTDDPFETLFAGVERRPQPSEAARESAFAAVTEEWEALQARRAARRRFVPPLAAAAAVLVGVIGLVTLRQPAAPPIALELAQGHIRVGDTAYRAARGPVFVEVGRDETIKALEPTRWVAGAGADVRFANGSEFAWQSHGAIRLQDGRVYVATWDGASVSVETDYGVVTDIGTRFVVASRDDRLEVAVREGQIELATPAETRRTEPVEPGYARVFVAENGRIAQHTEAASHARWNWIQTVAKGYVTRNPVTMLHEIARDLGREVRLGEGVEASLQGEKLDGDYRSLAPWAALRHLTNTVGAEWRDQNGVITIFFKD